MRANYNYRIYSGRGGKWGCITLIIELIYDPQIFFQCLKVTKSRLMLIPFPVSLATWYEISVWGSKSCKILQLAKLYNKNPISSNISSGHKVSFRKLIHTGE